MQQRGFTTLARSFNRCWLAWLKDAGVNDNEECKMFKIKVYKNVETAIMEAKAWLKRTFPHGSFSMEAGDEECGNEDFGPTKDALGWIDTYFPELDQRQGHLIVHA